MDNISDNERVLQYINEVSSNSLQRYLDLAPSAKPQLKSNPSTIRHLDFHAIKSRKQKQNTV